MLLHFLTSQAQLIPIVRVYVCVATHAWFIVGVRPAELNETIKTSAHNHKCSLALWSATAWNRWMQILQSRVLSQIRHHANLYLSFSCIWLEVTRREGFALICTFLGQHCSSLFEFWLIYHYCSYLQEIKQNHYCCYLSSYLIFLALIGPGVFSASNRNEKP
jgi:hypothetical protein